MATSQNSLAQMQRVGEPLSDGAQWREQQLCEPNMRFGAWVDPKRVYAHRAETAFMQLRQRAGFVVGAVLGAATLRQVEAAARRIAPRFW